MSLTPWNCSSAPAELSREVAHADPEQRGSGDAGVGGSVIDNLEAKVQRFDPEPWAILPCGERALIDVQRTIPSPGRIRTGRGRPGNRVAGADQYLAPPRLDRPAS